MTDSLQTRIAAPVSRDHAACASAAILCAARAALPLAYVHLSDNNSHVNVAGCAQHAGAPMRHVRSGSAPRSQVWA